MGAIDALRPRPGTDRVLRSASGAARVCNRLQKFVAAGHLRESGDDLVGDGKANRYVVSGTIRAAWPGSRVTRPPVPYCAA